MTKGQTRAMEVLWPLYGLTYAEDVPVNFEQTFGRDAPVVMEIGFGDGDALAQMAALHPEQNFIGVEVHTPGVGSLLIKMEEQDLRNIRVFNHDAVEILQNSIGSGQLDRIQLFFPDPWHKKRHHKRRILTPGFINQVHDKMRSGGVFHFATDWEDYAEEALEQLEGFKSFRNCNQSGGFSPRPDWRPETKFERRGKRLGHGVWDILMQKVDEQ
ncbi:MAG: tRNA (guanosine(46)-N7)-methyltransferase TrmB [Acidiferrobacterales bacterium]|nr:tRNA (guanosine(46)-N7)-methyltransferase TrmB [Acidiferrobacterales bacterium]